ncbi:MAG: hypothetical protein BroJett014_15660 [Planctomycetota bacterium]|nr:MAG: hypothetical protein BroJett014_15660 [Planctomycetota bacterium]
MQSKNKLSTSVLLVMGSYLPLCSRNRGEAVGEVVKRLGPPTAVKLRRRFGSHKNHAEDAVQRFSLRLAARSFRYRPQGKPEGWFFRGCERKMLDILDTEKAQQTVKEGWAETLNTGAIYAAAFFKSVAWDWLSEAAKLSSVEKRVVELHVGEDWTFAEIGGEYGEDFNWACRQYQVALRKLSRIM